MLRDNLFWMDLNKDPFGTSRYYSKVAVKEYLEEIYEKHGIRQLPRMKSLRMVCPQADKCCLTFRVLIYKKIDYMILFYILIRQWYLSIFYKIIIHQKWWVSWRYTCKIKLCLGAGSVWPLIWLRTDERLIEKFSRLNLSNYNLICSTVIKFINMIHLARKYAA